MAPLFGPRQLGVGIRGGCEAAIHSARRYIQSLAPDYIMVKLDFANAFNSLHRSDMLLSVNDRLPDCMPFASHRTHSHRSCILDRMSFCPRSALNKVTRWDAPFLFHHSSSHYFAELRPYLGLFGRSHSGWPSECGRRGYSAGNGRGKQNRPLFEPQ